MLGLRAGGFCQMKVAVGENGWPLKRCRLHGCSAKARSLDAFNRLQIVLGSLQSGSSGRHALDGEAYRAAAPEGRSSEISLMIPRAG